MTPEMADRIASRYPITHVLDVGANTGDTVKLWLERGAQEVHAVEPIPDCYTKLIDRYAHEPKVTCHRLGVSDRLYVHENLCVTNCWTLLPHDSTLLERAVEYRDAKPFDVVFTTIDRLLDSTAFRPTFVKIDVDGYELKALRGARQFIHTVRPPILLEVSYLPRILGDCCECLISEALAGGYIIEKAMGDGSEGPRYTKTKDFMRIFPWDTSFDVMLHPI